MKVTVQNVETGFNNWFAKEIATLSWTHAGLYPLVALFIGNAKKKYAKVIEALLDEEGLLDLDVLHKEYSAILNTKGSVEIMNTKLTTADIDKLVEYIKNTVVSTVTPTVGGTI